MNALQRPYLGFVFAISLGLAALTSSEAHAGKKKDRKLMQAAAVDIVNVCSAIVVSRDSLDSAVSGKDFEIAKTSKIGQASFKKVYRKTYGNGMFKTISEVAVGSKGECVTKVTNNYESEALWGAVDSGLLNIGYQNKDKPIVASGMYIGSYKKGSRILVAIGRSGQSQSTTIITRK
ncbi:hypothetical protein [Shimia sediminis]|uniref:hypothetical protein n=1 Tax=Shimia sediminis TaxID=2497945 RepID=UPI000F8D6A72|nr:hypothetical protein [Shimia sediminis]